MGEKNKVNPFGNKKAQGQLLFLCLEAISHLYTDNWIHVLIGIAFTSLLLKQEIRGKAMTLGLLLYLISEIS